MKKLKKYFGTLLFAAITAYFTTQNHFGFVLAFLAPVLLIYFVIGLILLLRRPVERRQRAIRMGIWFLVLVAGCVMQHYWATAARQQGNAVAQAVQAFQAHTGRYPQTLADVHIDAAGLEDRWMLSYRLVDGKPMLDYASTALPMDVYAFDFGSGKWVLDSY
jgi:hypothetical protein